MSYSFSGDSVNKDHAKKYVKEELKKIADAQPVHHIDLAQAQAAAESFIDLLPDPAPDTGVSVQMAGSVSWTGTDKDPSFTSVAVSIHVMLKPGAGKKS